MKIQLIKTQKSSDKLVAQLVARYQERLKPFAQVEMVHWKALPSDWEKQFGADAVLILLDERGAQWSSTELAKKLQTWQDDPRVKRVAFVIGPPYGFGPLLQRPGVIKWSLSAATFPTELAWLLAWEQLYRGFSILRGTPYHHE